MSFRFFRIATIRIINGLYNRTARLWQYIKFKLKYPKVAIVKPLKIGTYYSQDGQDLYLSSLLFNYLCNNSNPWIVDVGCNHPSNYSNSLFFEKWLNCRTLAIDPIEEFSVLWKNLRPKSIFVGAAIGTSSEPVVLKVPTGEQSDSMFASVEGGVYKAEYGGEYVKRTIKCLSLSTLLSSHDISEVLLLSIDVEGLELEVIKSIDFKACLVRCIVLENNSSSLYGSDDIRDYLMSRQFTFHSRIGYLDDVYVHSSIINGRN